MCYNCNRKRYRFREASVVIGREYFKDVSFYFLVFFDFQFSIFQFLYFSLSIVQLPFCRSCFVSPRAI